MAFDTYGTASSNSSKKSDVDFEAMNQYVVETAGLQERETLVGVVAGLVDLGTQKMPDAENVFKGTPEDEEAEIAKFPNTYFKDGFDPDTRKPARLKCYPQKPVQAVAVAVDFPDIIIDRGQFFGNSNPQPLRLWLGGNFYMENLKQMVIARPTPLKVVNIDKAAAKPKWSFSPLHLFHKMAVAAKLIKPGEVFLPNNIDQLIGKAFQFEAQVFFKESKGKQYFTEYIKFVSGLGRGQVTPETENQFMIQFNKPNKPEDLKQLRNHVINTIKNAENYEGSLIQKQLEAPQDTPQDDDNDTASDGAGNEVKVPQKARSAPKKSVPAPVDMDDESPF